nr:hypothetical protein [Tanacetum cinerariifolium]
MEPEENDRDDEKSEGDSIDYMTSGGDNDANDDGDDLSEDDADDEDEEESSDNEEEEEEHLAPTVLAPALYEIGESSVAAAAARQIRPTLTIADTRRADDKLIGRLRRERGDIFAPWLPLMQRRMLTLVIIVLGSWTTVSHE